MNVQCLLDLVNAKCYCQYKNGASPNNGIVCKTGLKLQLSGYCLPDEHCTGPADENGAVDGKNKTQLCSESKCFQ